MNNKGILIKTGKPRSSSWASWAVFPSSKVFHFSNRSGKIKTILKNINDIRSGNKG